MGTPRLVHLIDQGRLGGGPRYVEEVSLALRARGVDVAVVLPFSEAQEGLRRRLVRGGVVTRILPSSAPGPARAEAARRAVAHLDGVVVLHTGDPAEVHWPLCGLVGRTVVVVVHVGAADPRDRRGFWRLVQRRAVLAGVDVVGFVGEGALAAWQHALPATTSIALVPGGVRAPTTPPPLLPRQGTLRLASAGHLEIATKAQDVAIDAVALLTQRGHDVNLRLYGEGADRALLERRAAEVHVGERVTFAGRYDDVSRVMADADVFLLTSRFGFEGLSLVLLEAMAHGRPCVVSRIAGYLEACGDAAIAADAGDADAVARAVAVLAADDDRRRALGDAARARAARFTWDATAAKLLDCVEEALRRRSLHEHR